MAMCDWCNQEMTADHVVTCKQTVTFPDGKEMQPVPYLANMEGGRCADCNVVDGGLHHPGCDNEACPRCGGQLITCGCL